MRSYGYDFLIERFAGFRLESELHTIGFGFGFFGGSVYVEREDGFIGEPAGLICPAGLSDVFI